jgi:hypothetical protein
MKLKDHKDVQFVLVRIVQHVGRGSCAASHNILIFPIICASMNILFIFKINQTRLVERTVRKVLLHIQLNLSIDFTEYLVTYRNMDVVLPRVVCNVSVILQTFGGRAPSTVGLPAFHLYKRISSCIGLFLFSHVLMPLRSDSCMRLSPPPRAVLKNKYLFVALSARVSTLGTVQL